MNTDPITLRDLEFYTIQNILKEYEEHVERENKEYEKQHKEVERQQTQMKLPSQNFGDFKTPKFDVPKFDIPKY